jgi:hypothetical protein
MALGHVPFHQTARDDKFTEGFTISAVPSDEVQGLFDGVLSIEGDAVRAQGWAYSSQSPIVSVVIVDDRQIALGHAALGLPRLDLRQSIGPAATRSGWIVYLRTRDGVGQMSAYVRTSSSSTWWPLRNRWPAPANKTPNGQ